MKKYLLLFLLLMISIAFAQTVTNTFENVSDLDNFSQTSPACDSSICNASLSSDVAHSGTQSLKFSVDDNSGLDQWLIYTYALPLNDSNTFSVWVNLPNNVGYHYFDFEIYCDGRPHYLPSPRIWTDYIQNINIEGYPYQYSTIFNTGLTNSYKCFGNDCLNNWYKVEMTRNGTDFNLNYYDSSLQKIYSQITTGDECTGDTGISLYFDPNYATTGGTFNIYLDDFSYDNSIPEISNTGCGTRCGSGTPIFTVTQNPIIVQENQCKLLFSIVGFNLTTCNFWILIVLLLLILVYKSKKRRR